MGEGQVNVQQQAEHIKHVLAFNPYRKGNMGSICSQPLEKYDKTTGYQWVKDLVAQIRGEKPIKGVDANDAKALAKAQEKLKKSLPFRAAYYYHFEGNKRRQDHIDPQSFLFQVTVDVDEKDKVEKALQMAKILDKEQWISDGRSGTKPNPWKGMLLHLEYSARKKLHIDIRMPVGMTIEETQRAYCKALGVPCDESCFSPERIIFITDAESEIYRSPHWYEVLPEEELAKRRKAFLDRGLSIDGRGVPQISQMNADFASQEKTEKSSETAGEKMAESTGQKASEKNLVAFDLFQQSAGLGGVDIDTQGSRHSSLLAIMSAGASRVMGEEELMAVVAQRMPSYANERDCQQLIHDFYTKYGDSSKPMSQAVIRINAQAEKSSQKDALASQSVKSVKSVGGSDTGIDLGEESYPDPPEMPKKLPGLVELLISKTPEVYKPAVAQAVFPSLATHLWRTTFRYIDNVEHEATLMCCLLAGTGAGKNCVQKPIDCIMADIRQRDRENLKREKEWKEEMMRKGANKDKRKRPENLVIQEIDADMTNPAFVMRTAEAQDHFLYTSLNEINQFDALRGQGGQQFVIMCLAFDPGNQYGQTRVSTQSITERVTIRFNWNASTTIHKGQKYFGRVLTDGPLSRINFCTIPEREIGAEMPVYGTYDEAFHQALQPYIDNLCKASGLVDCPEAFQLAVKLKDENADFSRMSQNRIFENLSFRANVIAYLKACVLYVANGMKWEPEMEDFIRWSEQYDLYCKMRFFADAIEKAENEGVKSSKRGPKNLLQQLPDEFSMQQAMEARLRDGLGAAGTRHMVNVWVSRGYIKRKDAEQADGSGAQGGNAQGRSSQGEGSGLSHSNHSFFIKLRYRQDGQQFDE